MHHFLLSCPRVAPLVLLRCAARYTVRTFSIRRNEKIAAHVTIRGERAAKILELGLKVKEYELKSKNFSMTGTSRRIFLRVDRWGVARVSVCVCGNIHVTFDAGRWRGP